MCAPGLPGGEGGPGEHRDVAVPRAAPRTEPSLRGSVTPTGPHGPAVLAAAARKPSKRLCPALSRSRAHPPWKWARAVLPVFPLRTVQRDVRPQNGIRCLAASEAAASTHGPLPPPSCCVAGGHTHVGSPSRRDEGAANGQSATGEPRREQGRIHVVAGLTGSVTFVGDGLPFGGHSRVNVSKTHTIVENHR